MFHNLEPEDQQELNNSMLGKHSKYFNISENDKNLIYTNKLIKDAPKYQNKSFVENGIIYKLNAKNYRSPDFIKNVDILFAGCSVTFGSGIPDEFMWPSIVAGDTSTYANLAQAGDSITGQVRRIFSYFKEYGHPKYLLAIFPDFNRITIPVNTKQMVTGGTLKQIKAGNFNDNEFNERLLQTAFIPNFIDESIKFEIKPFIAEHVLTPEIAHFYSAQAILMLEAYCAQSNIKLIWSTWDVKQFKIIKSLSYYSNLIDIEMDKWYIDLEKIDDSYFEKEERVLCHEDVRDKNKEVFNLGLDRSRGLHYAHWGSHRNAHVAEIFKNEMIK